MSGRRKSIFPASRLAYCILFAAMVVAAWALKEFFASYLPSTYFPRPSRTSIRKLLYYSIRMRHYLGNFATSSLPLSSLPLFPSRSFSIFSTQRMCNIRRSPKISRHAPLVAALLPPLLPRPALRLPPQRCCEMAEIYALSSLAT